MRFDINIPTRIHFGCGILEEAIHKENRIFSGTVLLVTTKGSEKFGVIDRLAGILEKMVEIVEVVKFSDITSNPKVSEINAGIDFAIRCGVRIVIGVGGGSAIDAAKAIAAGTGAGEHIDRFYFEGIQPDARTLPIIAIPTTAGTGSELSKSGILSCPERQMKSGVRGEHLYPTVAIVDSELTYTVPLAVTMETGFDVLTHAVESYLSKKSNYLTSILSEQAIAMVAESLPALATDITDHAARERMSYASMIMGINLGNASTVLPHRMQYPVGALTDTSHGKGLAALYPAWIELTYLYSADKFNHIGKLISGKPCTDSRDVLLAFEKFMDQTCGRPKLRDFGFIPEDAERLATMVTGNIDMDPAGNVAEIVCNIYKKALAE